MVGEEVVFFWPREDGEEEGEEDVEDEVEEEDSSSMSLSGELSPICSMGKKLKGTVSQDFLLPVFEKNRNGPYGILRGKLIHEKKPEVENMVALSL
jgi:hypothetical protein